MKKILALFAAAAGFCAGGCCCKCIRPEPPPPVPEKEAAANMARVCRFLKNAKVYFIASADKDQPRVRPFGTVNIYNGKLYIQTGRRKNVAKQLLANPKTELCAFDGKVWLRLAGTLREDPSIEAQKSMLDAYPELQKMYRPGDGNNMVLYFENATATFNSFTAPPETVRF